MTSSFTGQGYGTNFIVPAAVLEHAQAILTTETLSKQVGGEAAGESLLSVKATGDLMSKLCPNEATALECIGTRAYDACYLAQNGRDCQEMNMLLGNAVESAAQAYLESCRFSEVEYYFLRPTMVTTPKVVGADIAAIAVAAKTATR